MTSACLNVSHVMEIPLSMGLLLVGQCQERHFGMDITGTAEETSHWRWPKTGLTIAVLSYSILTAVVHSRRGRTASLALTSTTKMQTGAFQTVSELP